jgi:hypothetical protein
MEQQDDTTSTADSRAACHAPPSVQRTLATWREEGLPYTALTARTFRYEMARIEAWLANRHDKLTGEDEDEDEEDYFLHHDGDDEVENADPLFSMLDLMIPAARRLGADLDHMLRHQPYWDADRAREYGKQHGRVI